MTRLANNNNSWLRPVQIPAPIPATLYNVLGITIPGYASTSDYDPSGTNYATAETLPSLAKTYGMNWVAIQTTYTSTNISATDVTSGSQTLSDAAVVAQVAAAKSAGMKVCLKPHCAIADGSTQSLHIPGGQFSANQFPSTANSNSWTTLGTYSTGSTTVSATGSMWSISSTNIGDRVIYPANVFQAGGPDIPNSLYSTTYATGSDPVNSVLKAVLSATSFTLGNAGGTAINPAHTSSTGLVAIIHDATAATWFSNWQTTLLHLLSLAASVGGADALNLATEKEWITRNFPTQWRSLIATIRASYPNVLLFTQSSQGITYGADCGFIDALDAVGLSAYPTVGSASGGDSQSTVNANWVTAVGTIGPGYYSAWSKPVIFGEIGTTSTTDACFNPSAFGGLTAQNPSTEQAIFFTGMANACLGQTWFGGFFWWTGFSASNWAYFNIHSSYQDTTSYEPKAATVTAMQAKL